MSEPKNLKSLVAANLPLHEWEKFRLETLRIVLLTSLGAGVTWLVVDPLHRRDAYAAQIEGERLRVRSAIVDNFVSSASDYTAETFDVLMKTGNEDIKAWEGELIDNYREHGSRMAVHFGPEIDAEVKEASDLANALHKARKNPAASWGKMYSDLETLNKKIACDALVELKLVSASRCPKHP